MNHPERINHNLLFPQNIWGISPETQALRAHPQLHHTMDIGRHEALHTEVSHVPLLTSKMALRVLSLLDAFQETTDPIEAIGNLQLSIERSRQSRQFDAAERGVAGVALMALDMQREFFTPKLRQRL